MRRSFLKKHRKIINLLIEGNSVVKTAKLTKTPYGIVYTQMLNLAKEGKVQKPIRKINKNVEEILCLRREEGLTYEKIAANYGITRERIRQIIKKHAPNLTGYINSEPKFCHHCGINIEGSYKQRGRCRECGVLLAEKRRAEKHLARFKDTSLKISELQKKYRHYSEIGRILFPNSANHSQSIINRIRAWNRYVDCLPIVNKQLEDRKDKFLQIATPNMEKNNEHSCNLHQEPCFRGKEGD